MSLTWGELKKAIDEKLEDDAEIKEIRVSGLYYRGVAIHLDRARNEYVIINNENS